MVELRNRFIYFDIDRRKTTKCLGCAASDKATYGWVTTSSVRCKAVDAGAT